MSGADILYDGRPPLRKTRTRHGRRPRSLPAYAMSGTDLAYGSTVYDALAYALPTRCPDLAGHAKGALPKKLA
eukprot:3408838-Rhodomonas_salina.2